MVKKLSFRHARRAAVAVGLVGLMASVARPVLAADPPAAQSLFDEAKRMMADGRYSEACPKLEESERLDPGMGTLFQLAVCYQRVGRTASAWAAFLEVASQAKAAGQADRERAARLRASALEPALPWLLIGTRGGAAESVPGLEILRDGAVVGAGQWGTAVPVDPGKHKIVARAPGRKTWETTVTTPSDGTVVNVVVPKLEAEASVPASPMPPPRVTTPSPVTSPPPAPDSGATTTTIDWHRGSGQRTGGVVIGSVGIASLLGGGALVLASKSARDASSSHCVGNVCDLQGVQQRDDARKFGDYATVAIGAGAALVVGGIITYVTAPSPSNPSATTATTATARRPQVAPMVGNGVSGFMIRGAF